MITFIDIFLGCVDEIFQKLTDQDEQEGDAMEAGSEDETEEETEETAKPGLCNYHSKHLLWDAGDLFKKKFLLKVTLCAQSALHYACDTEIMSGYSLYNALVTPWMPIAENPINANQLLVSRKSVGKIVERNSKGKIDSKS